MSEHRTLPLPDGLDGLRLDVALSRLFGLSRTTAADLVDTGLSLSDGNFHRPVRLSQIATDEVGLLIGRERGGIDWPVRATGSRLGEDGGIELLMVDDRGMHAHVRGAARAADALVRRQATQPGNLAGQGQSAGHAAIGGAIDAAQQSSAAIGNRNRRVDAEDLDGRELHGGGSGNLLGASERFHANAARSDSYQRNCGVMFHAKVLVVSRPPRIVSVCPVVTQ